MGRKRLCFSEKEKVIKTEINDAGTDDEWKENIILYKTTSDVIRTRLNLLGITLKSIEKEFLLKKMFNGF